MGISEFFKEPENIKYNRVYNVVTPVIQRVKFNTALNAPPRKHNTSASP